MSAHLAIQAAIVAALTAAPAVASGNVKANTTRPVAASSNLAVVVRMTQSRADTPQILGGPYDWTTSFQVECLARASSGSADPVAAVDALLELVWARLSALNTTGLGVYDVRMQPAIDWEVDDAETPVAAATVSLLVNHRTTSTSLAAWS
jgi:hypothetical protein